MSDAGITSFKESSYFLSAKIGGDFKSKCFRCWCVTANRTIILDIVHHPEFFKHGISKSGSVSIIYHPTLFASLEQLTSDAY
jgi:hypothetical protein